MLNTTDIIASQPNSCCSVKLLKILRCSEKEKVVFGTGRSEIQINLVLKHFQQQ